MEILQLIQGNVVANPQENSGDRQLIHGMNQEEFDEEVKELLTTATDHNGDIDRDALVDALASIEIGLTKRECNALILELDVADGLSRVPIERVERVLWAFLQKCNRLKLLDLDMPHSTVQQFLEDLWASRDTELSGRLEFEDLRDLLHSAQFGLSYAQLMAVLSVAEVSDEGTVSYRLVTSPAGDLLRATVSATPVYTEQQRDEETEKEKEFNAQLDQALEGILTPMIAVDDIREKLQSAGIDKQETNALINSMQKVQNSEQGKMYCSLQLLHDANRSLGWRVVKLLRLANLQANSTPTLLAEAS